MEATPGERVHFAFRCLVESVISRKPLGDARIIHMVSRRVELIGVFRDRFEELHECFGQECGVFRPVVRMLLEARLHYVDQSTLQVLAAIFLR